jgi:hypothetical protein
MLKLCWVAACLALGMDVTYAQDGRFPVFFQNQTQGEYGDDQIFIYGLGLNAANQWCRVMPDGSMRPLDPADATAPGHLTKHGVSYAAYAFPLSQAGNFKMPPHVRGGRLYVSVGEPMYFPISANGWGGPDLLSPSDPNADVIFDWYEMSYVFGQAAFGGNTTQVDQFGLPMTARLKQDAIHYDQTIGITLSRDQVFAQYKNSVGSRFKALAGDYRIIAPRSSPVFRPGGPGADYLDEYIDAVWAYYAAHPFTLTRLAVTFKGQVVDGKLKFTRSPPGPDGAGPFYLSKPTGADVFACEGALAQDGMKTSELELGADLAAALNRGVALNDASWYNASAYYAGPVKNEYSMFFHGIGIDKRSYGFAYDDVNDQSSVKILPNSNPPTSLTLAVGSIKKAVRVLSIAKPAKRGNVAGLFSADGRLAPARSPLAAYGAAVNGVPEILGLQ